jgi:SAM-dependent methyltransferase
MDYEQIKADDERMTISTGEVFVRPRWLPQIYLAHCTLLSDRSDIIRRLPRRGVVAEVGTLRGNLAKLILKITEPREFHIFDLSFDCFDRAFFESEVLSGRVILHEGDSSTEMSALPEAVFDWIYIDGDHSFEGVSRDIREAKRLIRPNGFLVFNDYTIYCPLQRRQFGVVRAVNDLCLDEDFEMVMFALNVLGYYDVALRHPSSPSKLSRVLEKIWPHLKDLPLRFSSKEI